MTAIFERVLNMSLTGSIVIAVVLLPMYHLTEVTLADVI